MNPLGLWVNEKFYKNFVWYLRRRRPLALGPTRGPRAARHPRHPGTPALPWSPVPLDHAPHDTQHPSTQPQWVRTPAPAPQWVRESQRE
jgi:hypothetical protein